MLYEPERGFPPGRLYDLEHHFDFQVDCKQNRVVPRDTLPLRPRSDSSVTDATLISAPSTSSTTSLSPDRDEHFEISSVSSYDSDAGPPEQYQNPRRTSVGITPPSLQRCDYKHKIFVEGLLAVTTSFVETIWPLSRETPRSSIEFNGAGVLPLRTFIQETCRRSKTSYSTLQIALYYLVLLKGVLPSLDFTHEQPRESNFADRVPKDPQILLGQPSGPSGCRVMQCGRRMFMSALMLAAKYLQDRNFSVKAWAKLSGLSCLEINQNEKAYLQSIEYRLHLKKEYFDNWSQIVVELCQSAKLQGSLDYLKIIRRLNPEVIHNPANTKHFLKEVGEGRYHAGCSHQLVSFYCDDNNPRPQFLQNSPKPPLIQPPSMQTPRQPLLRAKPDSAIRVSIQLDDHIPRASKHTCPPPRPVYTSTSTDLGPQSMRASCYGILHNAQSDLAISYSRGFDNMIASASNAQTTQASVREILHNTRSSLAISYSTRFDAKIAIGSSASCLPQPPRPEEKTSASINLVEHMRPPFPTPSLSTKSASSSPESAIESVFSDGVGMMSRSRSSSMSSAVSFGSQQSFRLEGKAIAHVSPLRSSVIAGAVDVDIGYQSQAETVVADEPSHFRMTPEKPQAMGGSAKRKTPSAPTPSENHVAATLTMLSKNSIDYSLISNAENKMSNSRKAPKKRGPPKSLKPGHTSEQTKAKRQKERASSRTVKTHDPALDIASPVTFWSSDFNAQDLEEEKENQLGHQYWAATRRPIPSRHNPSKRYAQTAPGLAADHLRAEMVKKLGLAR